MSDRTRWHGEPIPEKDQRVEKPVTVLGPSPPSIAFSTGAGAIAAGADGLEARDREVLLGYARDTWRSVAAMADGRDLPFDGLRHHINGSWEPSLKTTPTDIASYLWSVLAAERLKIIGADEARRRLERTLQALERLERVHGFFHEWLDPRTGAVLASPPITGSRSRRSSPAWTTAGSRRA